MSCRRSTLRSVIWLHCLTVFVFSEPEVQLNFAGDHVFASGFGNFTALGRSDITVKCTVSRFERRDVTYTLKILKEGHIIQQRSNNHDLFLYQHVEPSIDPIVFQCHLKVNFQHANVVFEKQTTVTLNFVHEGNVPQCFSNKGTIGLQTESADFICVDCTSISSDRPGSHGRLEWTSEDIERGSGMNNYNADCQYVTGATSFEDVEQRERRSYSCAYSGRQGQICSVRMEIHEDLTLQIVPLHFDATEQQFHFTCFSSPPSKVHWNIYTEVGDVLRIISQREENFPNLEKHTQTKINITYAHGQSILNLTTTTRVYLVSCWTFRKMFRQVASTAVPYTTDENCTSMVTEQSTLPDDRLECLSKCVSDNTSYSQSFQKCINERIVYFIIIGGMFVMVIILAAYHITRLLKKSSCRLASNNTEQNDNLPPMVTNTAYVEYNDTHH